MKKQDTTPIFFLKSFEKCDTTPIFVKKIGNRPNFAQMHYFGKYIIFFATKLKNIIFTILLILKFTFKLNYINTFFWHLVRFFGLNVFFDFWHLVPVLTAQKKFPMVLNYSPEQVLRITSQIIFFNTF